jgi:diguanylate cyclase (GGDEF)-like protein/PAS domain S-box-containing protein
MPAFSGAPGGCCVLASDETGRDRESPDRQEIRQELDATQRSLERAIARANRMAFEAEVVNIELQQIFNNAVDAMWILDLEGRVLRVNDTMLSLLGRKREEAVGALCRDLFPEGVCRPDECPLGAIRGGSRRISRDLDVSSEEGSRSLTLTVTPFYGVDKELVGVVQNLRDITERKRMEEALQTADRELQGLASMDGLTQVANRRSLDETLRREWKRMKREGKSLSFILCDVDHFKVFNDTYGHLEGDGCLKTVAAAIRGQLKRPSDRLARYGGDELAVVLPDTPPEGALKVAEAIRTAVCDLRIRNRRSLVEPFVTMSLGVSSATPDDAMEVDALVESADDALYAAKKDGRNQSVLLPLPRNNDGRPR